MWADVRDGEVYQVFEAPRGFRDANGTLHDKSVLTSWSYAALATIGIYPVRDEAEEVPRFHRLVDYDYQFDAQAEEVVRTAIFEPIGLEEAKARAKEIVNEWKYRMQTSNFVYDGAEFQCDPVSRDWIMGASLRAFIAKSLGQPFEIAYRDAANVDHALDADGMIALGVAAASHVEYWFEQAKLKKAAIDAAETVEQVEDQTPELEYHP